jgi:hypothetical protein
MLLYPELTGVSWLQEHAAGEAESDVVSHGAAVGPLAGHQVHADAAVCGSGGRGASSDSISTEIVETYIRAELQDAHKLPAHIAVEAYVTEEFDRPEVYAQVFTCLRRFVCASLLSLYCCR